MSDWSRPCHAVRVDEGLWRDLVATVDAIEEAECELRMLYADLRDVLVKIVG